MTIYKVCRLEMAHGEERYFSAWNRRTQATGIDPMRLEYSLGAVTVAHQRSIGIMCWDDIGAAENFASYSGGQLERTMVLFEATLTGSTRGFRQMSMDSTRPKYRGHNLLMSHTVLCTAIELVREVARYDPLGSRSVGNLQMVESRK